MKRHLFALFGGWRWPATLALGLLTAALGLWFATRPLSGVFALMMFTAFDAIELHVVLLLALALNALRLAWLAWLESRAGRVPTRLTNVLWAGTNALGAWLAWLWPDAATVLLGYAFALGLLWVAAALARVSVGGARAGRRARSSPHTISPQESRPPTLPANPRHRWPAAIAATLSLALVGSAAWGSYLLTKDIARVDEFYAWNQPIPETPGTVLRVEPYTGEVPTGAEALRVLYASTYSDGTPALASAVVAYPSATRGHEDDTAGPPGEGRQVLAWQHGTTGVAESCGPSVGSIALSEYAIPGISRAIERDWVVVATDYPGQGTAGRYPYLIGEGEGRATLDAIRAVGAIEAADASKSAWIWGHSQGGHATLWAAQLAPDYAPEIEVTGVAALSAAWDPLAMAQRVTGAESSVLGGVITSMVLVPYADEYTDVSLAGTVHPAGEGIVRAFASRCVAEPPTLVSVLVGAALGNPLGKTLGLPFTDDAPLYRLDVSSGAIHARLSQNIANPSLLTTPLFLGQGVDDEVIPIEMQRRLRVELCGGFEDSGIAGNVSAVEAHEYPGRTHMGVIAAGAPLIDDLYAWAEAVEGGTRPGNCPGP